MATNNNSFTKKQISNNTTTTSTASVNHNTNKHSHRTRQRNVLYCTSIGTTMTEASLEVYTSGFKEVFIVPKRDIVHMPDAEILKNVARLILCANFQAEDPERSCKMGKRCRFVHADLAHALNHNIHINYAWRSVDQVVYERFDESLGQLEVAPPNGKVPDMLIPAHRVLKTNAISDPRRPLSHCAHYYYSRACNRGPECSFIHAVYVDADARDHQRAPAPSRDKHGLTAQYPAILHNDHQADHRPSPNQRHQRSHNTERSDGGERPANDGFDSEDRSRSIFLAVGERSELTLPSMRSPLTTESQSLGVSCIEESYDEELHAGLSFISVTEDTTTLDDGMDNHKQTNPLEPQQQQRSHHHRTQQPREHIHSSAAAGAATQLSSTASVRQSKDGGLCCFQSFAHDEEEFMSEANTSDGRRTPSNLHISTGSANSKASSAAPHRQQRPNRSPAFLPRPVGPRNLNASNGSRNSNNSCGERPVVHSAPRLSINHFTNVHEESEQRTIQQQKEETSPRNTLTAPRFRYNPYSFARACVVV